ncbi:hypothetical protein C6499_22645 [Candidatus Poribacteria bacterium]|nr:MAG: hypothetical protein C6499_22645 [Candidatus Poribacteria bacterium]
MNDIRTQLPECPLEYEVPLIPGKHTALLITIHAEDIDWQEKMLPWTLASLINNTDLIMKGIHLYIVCDHSTETRIQTALKKFDLPENTILAQSSGPLATNDYDSIPVFDINYWAFRDASNTHKLDIGDTLKHNKIEAEPYPPLPKVSPSPSFYDMTHCTVEQFRHAIKQLMGAQLAMKI